MKFTKMHYRQFIISAVKIQLILMVSFSLFACANKFDETRSQSEKQYSHAITHANSNKANTTLSKIVNTNKDQTDNSKGGFFLLHEGMDALAAIIYLTKTAEHSLELQYWSLHQDKTGKAVMYHLLKAADRGVRIRILLDDFIARGGNATLNTLASHPNIELKLYNPISKRKWLRTFSLIMRFNRSNRRMHNKVFIADKSVAIVGGRNIGDAYYAAKASYMYRDLGVIAIGPVVKDVSISFDEYWNAKWAVPLSQLNRRLFLGIHYKDKRQQLTDDFLKFQSSSYWHALSKNTISKKIKNSKQYFTWAHYKVIYDPPNKVKGIKKKNKKFLEYQMTRHMAQATDNVKIITPYFVPQRFGLRWTKMLNKKGVKVTILTNSFAANDFSIAHGGYQRYRIKLLKNGVNLYEFRPSAIKQERNKITWFTKKPVARLHAKSIVIDDRYVYIGSVNLTPRSRYLNTEISIRIDSTTIAQQLNQSIAALTSEENSYHLTLRQKNDHNEMDFHTENYELTWNANKSNRNSESDPEVSLLKHFTISFLSLLPIEDLL